MGNIRNRVIKKAILVGLFLSILFGGIVFFYELESIDKEVVALSKEETKIFKFDDLADFTVEALKDKVASLLDTHFVVVEMYDLNKKKILEEVRQDKDKVEAVLKQFDHSFPIVNEVSYKKFYINNTFFLQILLPVIDKNSQLVGYFEGVYEADHNKIHDIQFQMWTMVCFTILIVVVTTIFLTPIIFALNRDLSVYSQKLLRANVDVLQVLGGAIAKRDTDTNIHNYRVTIYAVKLAEQIKLDTKEIPKLIKGAFLHDVGKIAISDNILLKPGKLTEEEFETMKTHVKHGMDIIKHVEWLNDGRDIVAYHHEQYSGNGYLEGLSGEDIPLNARIFAISDVFDALTSERPYKVPFTYEKAIGILHEGSGTHFDPKLIDEFSNISKNLYDSIAKKNENEIKILLIELLNKYFS